MLEITQKKCSKCKVEQDISCFYKDNRAKDLLQCSCIICSKSYYAENNESVRQRVKCYYNKNQKNIIAYSKEYYHKNKESISIKKKVYNLKNKDDISIYKKQYRYENKEAISKNLKMYYQKNKDYILNSVKINYIKNRKLKAEYHRHYRVVNKIALQEYRNLYAKTAKGMAISKNVMHSRRQILGRGDVTTKQLTELLNNAKVCYWCNVSLKKVKVHIDHYVPLAKGGEHTLSNLVISCQKCNNQKGAKDPIEFANIKSRLL